ncbi:hypothetical protein [Streptomyces canus]|uniref:hypothetical protein n=1 Tax=Streptomyces canus TaxID=58343 RepID=UPI002E32361F|nr:hypothetical protein [Streptomyces canus]
MRGTVTVIDKGIVRVHSYMAPDTGLNVTTQLIETPNLLIAVDGQVNVADAGEVVEYAKGLGNRWTASSSPMTTRTTTMAQPASTHPFTRWRSYGIRWRAAATSRT